jgi:hypothetical protein
MPVSGPAGRLEDLLEQIRVVFDSVSQDVEHSKTQHNDYERRGTCDGRLTNDSGAASPRDGESQGTTI